MNRFLTKSRFKTALECPSKLYYTGKPDRYPDLKLQDDFLQALAEGGYQVGELAKLYFPGGIEVHTLDKIEAIKETDLLLAQENVIIYEGAFAYQQLFIRADIVIKKGRQVELIEVKAKSFEEGNDDFLGKKAPYYLLAKWIPYVYDVAFQKYVFTQSKPSLTVTTSLMLANKAAKTSVEGLNQKFLLVNERGRKGIKIMGSVESAALGYPILIKKNVDEIIERIYQGTDVANPTVYPFEDAITKWSDSYSKDEKIITPLGARCGKCEFQVSSGDHSSGKLSGFRECWTTQANFTDVQFDKPSVLNIWNHNGKEKNILEGRYFQEQLTRIDLEPKTPGKVKVTDGWTRTDRKWLQVEKSKALDNTHHYLKDEIAGHIQSWKFPLHFIDFETTAVAIPFNAGRIPYEQIAFQFSHHTVDGQGIVTHQGQWINTKKGYFPNFDFIRALKKELENDTGTIFKYAPHENNILNTIYFQLEQSGETDRLILMEWIQTITHSTSSSTISWTGARDMVDLLELVVKYYYHPETNGSNSLKKLLPAVIGSSDYLLKKYSAADYGEIIQSLNYTAHRWISYDEDNKIISPYETLPLIHEGIANEDLDDLLMDEEAGITDGGAAMTAYAKMQFMEMTDAEHSRVRDALLRYCELDTLAMVMLYEAWREWTH